jgi:hypothetical protein
MKPTISIRKSLTTCDFDRIRRLAFEDCGLDIEPGKEDLEYVQPAIDRRPGTLAQHAAATSPA